MALTDQQKADIRLYVGWSARFHQTDTRLEGAMTAVGDLPEHSAQIVDLLAKLKTIDSDLIGSHGRLKANTVGSIELNRSELGQRRSEGRRLVGRICSILGVPPGADVFGSGGVSRFVDFGSASAGGGGNYVGK